MPSRSEPSPALSKSLEEISKDTKEGALPNLNNDGKTHEPYSSRVQTLLDNNPVPAEWEATMFAPRFKQRLAIADAWSINPGSKVLDIGVGQGDSATLLALALGPVQSAEITAIDPAPPTYGQPYPLGEAHAIIKARPLGRQITFLQAETIGLLQSGTAPVFDAATFSHSLWYFPTPKVVQDTFAAIGKAGTSKIYLADYDLAKPPSPDQEAHHLAATVQQKFFACQAEKAAGAEVVTRANVRAAPDRTFTIAAARDAGYEVVREGWLTPDADYYEPQIEVGHIVTKFRARVIAEQLGEEREKELLGYIPRVEAAFKETLARGLHHARSVDVWWVEFGRKVD